MKWPLLRPSDEWMRDVASKTRGSDVYKCFARTVSLQIGQLREMRLLKKGQEIDVAIDMHLIPRYDKRYGAELVRSKAKDGTHVFERYITIQCIDQRFDPLLFFKPVCPTFQAGFRQAARSASHNSLWFTSPQTTSLIRSYFFSGFRYLSPIIRHVLTLRMVCST